MTRSARVGTAIAMTRQPTDTAFTILSVSFTSTTLLFAVYEHRSEMKLTFVDLEINRVLSPTMAAPFALSYPRNPIPLSVIYVNYWKALH